MANRRLRPRVSSLRPFKEWVAYLLILDLLVVALAAISIGHGRVAAENNALIDAQNTAKLLTQNLRAVFDKFDVSLILLKEAAEQRDIRRDAAAIDAAATRIYQLHPELEYLRVADADGNVFLGTGRTPPAQINIATREYFKKLRDNPDAGLVFSEPLKGYGSGTWSIVLARRFGSSSASFAGIVFAVLRLDWIQDQFAAINLGTKGAISLRALDLSTVARYPRRQVSVSSLVTRPPRRSGVKSLPRTRIRASTRPSARIACADRSPIAGSGPIRSM